MSTPIDSPGGAQEMNLAGPDMLGRVLRELPSASHADLAQLMQLFSSGSPEQLEKLQALEEKFYKDHMSLWTQMATAGDAPATLPRQDDHRFDAPEWGLPFFQYLRQAYLLNTRFLLSLGELPELAPSAKRRLQFQLRQFTDAMSPNNFATTNPEVIKLATQTGGESLARGVKMLADDVARGRISMSDEQAFAVGRNLAITPGAVVFENEVMQLIQYAPAMAQTREIPLLIVPPFINKYYILDLQPENSFVRFCVAEGFTTFIVSWRNIPPALGHLGWDDYIDKGVLAPLQVIRSITGAGQVNTLGFCVGGTLLSSALAVKAARKQNDAASLTLLATMLDFSDPGEISVYIDREFVEQCEQEFRQSGAMSGSKLAQTFASLRANELIWHFVVNNYLKGRTPRAFDLLYWNTDGSNLPGRLYAYYLRNMYLENNLRIPGKLEASGVPLNLGAIDVPAYIMATREDHIVPWRAAFASAQLLGGPTEFVLGASGHVAGIVNPASQNRRHYWRNEAGNVNAERWLEGASQHDGSWWTHWAAWLGGRSGNWKPAPAVAGNQQFVPIEPAPGRYVKETDSAGTVGTHQKSTSKKSTSKRRGSHGKEKRSGNRGHGRSG